MAAQRLGLVYLDSYSLSLDVATSASLCLCFCDATFFAMFSKKNLLGASMVLYLDVVMNEEEVLSIFNDLTTKNPPFPYWKFDKIEVQFKTPPPPPPPHAEVKAEFRFAPYEIELLSQTLRIQNSPARTELWLLERKGF